MNSDNNLGPKKINWFKRLFYSWNRLVDYFEKHYEQQKERMQKVNENFAKIVESNVVKEIRGLIDKNNESNNLKNEIEKLRDQKQQIEIKLTETKSELKLKSNNNLEKDTLITTLSEKINKFKEEIAKAKTIDKMESLLTPGIKTLKNMNDYFFQNGGKGESKLHESLVEGIILKSKLPEQTYKKNLNFSNKQRVEFALNSGDNKHWIPVDAKAYTPDKKGPDGQYVIDANFISKIRKGAKEITKYLDKNDVIDSTNNESNLSTTYYGILVMISDEIYSDTCNKFMYDINDIFHQYKIIVCSPTNFIQFGWFLQNNLQLIERYKNYDQTINDCSKLIGVIEKLMEKFFKIKKDFDDVYNKTCPQINKIKEKIYPQLPYHTKK